MSDRSSVRRSRSSRRSGGGSLGDGHEGDRCKNRCRSFRVCWLSTLRANHPWLADRTSFGAQTTTIFPTNTSLSH